MKTLTSFIVALICTVQLFAQAPSGFNYQALLRDASGNIKANSNTNLRIDILQGSASGTIIFAETFATQTNALQIEAQRRQIYELKLLVEKLTQK